MRQIKFRGESVEGSKLYQGYLVVYPNLHYTHWIITAGGDPNQPVKPESVVQFIGVDANGVEVWEDDPVERIARDGVPLTEREREKTFPMAATFEDYGAIRDGEIVSCVR